MPDDKKMTQFTIMDIIERKIYFINTNTIFAKDEYEEGALTALNEMLIDVNIMNETEFTNKYLDKVAMLSIKFKNEEFKDPAELEKMEGYNNTIVKILSLINPLFEYDLNDET